MFRIHLFLLLLLPISKPGILAEKSHTNNYLIKHNKYRGIPVADVFLEKYTGPFNFSR